MLLSAAYVALIVVACSYQTADNWGCFQLCSSFIDLQCNYKRCVINVFVHCNISFNFFSLRVIDFFLFSLVLTYVRGNLFDLCDFVVELSILVYMFTSRRHGDVQDIIHYKVINSEIKTCQTF